MEILYIEKRSIKQRLHEEIKLASRWKGFIVVHVLGDLAMFLLE